MCVCASEVEMSCSVQEKKNTINKFEKTAYKSILFMLYKSIEQGMYCNRNRQTQMDKVQQLYCVCFNSTSLKQHTMKRQIAQHLKIVRCITVK